MSLASSRQSFLANALFTSTQNQKLRPKIPLSCSCRQKQEEWKDPEIKKDNKLAKLAMVTLAAGVLSIGSVSDALAAKSGGRIGGQAFRSSAPRSAPRINNSRTNIYINPPVAPPLVGGYGYGYSGYGWSPFSFFAPAPSVAVGVAGGFDSLVFFILLGAVAAVVRKFSSSRRDDDDEDYY